MKIPEKLTGSDFSPWDVWKYPLVMTNIAMVEPWPIEIDDLPMKHGGSFHGELLNKQMLYLCDFYADISSVDDPRCSMYGIFTYIYPKNSPNVDKYSIHGASGDGLVEIRNQRLVEEG